MAEKESEWAIYIRGSEILASSNDHARTYYHYATDEMGSITHIVDENEILNEYEYDVWGNITNQKETILNRFKFNGQQLDPITQQYYLRARFYNPVIARFTQEDTYRGDGLNLYAYCKNNPVKYVDPTGNACKNKAEILAENRAKGKAYEIDEFNKFKMSHSDSVSQVTLKTKSGITTRVDAIGFNQEGKLEIYEFKSSQSAPLTKNQSIAFPEIFESGATVVGSGKGIFTKGYTIPSGIEIYVKRPGN